MKRSKKKGPFVLLKHHKNDSLLNKNKIFVLKRNFEITFRLVGITCYVYDGRNFIRLNISENMVNHKLGEFVPTRGKFVYKSKKKKKKIMGQKINPNIFRLGITKHWKTEFFEKKPKELSRYTFKDLELKDYIERFFNRNGIFLHDYRQKFNNSSLVFYISFFITPLFFTKTKTNIKQKKTNLILINNKGEILKIKKIHRFYKSYMKKYLKKRQWISGFIKYRKTITNSLVNYKSFKISGIKIIKYFNKVCYSRFKIYKLKTKSIRKYKIIKSLKGNFLNFFKAINLFTNNNHKVILHVSCFNKELKRLTTKKDRKFLKLKLKRFENLDFFKEIIELLFNSITNKNSAHLITKCVAMHIKKNKRHKSFLSFLKKILTPLLNSNVSILKGIKVKLKGRLNGAPRAKHKTITIGDISIQSISTFIDYSYYTTHNKDGSYGIKVWTVLK